MSDMEHGGPVAADGAGPMGADLAAALDRLTTQFGALGEQFAALATRSEEDNARAEKDRKFRKWVTAAGVVGFAMVALLSLSTLSTARTVSKQQGSDKVESCLRGNALRADIKAALAANNVAVADGIVRIVGVGQDTADEIVAQGIEAAKQEIPPRVCPG